MLVVEVVVELFVELEPVVLFTALGSLADVVPAKDGKIVSAVALIDGLVVADKSGKDEDNDDDEDASVVAVGVTVVVSVVAPAG